MIAFFGYLLLALLGALLGAFVFGWFSGDRDEDLYQ